ncbi:MAG: CoB--CoM heterodisulfide reductase iron-sulfur subunit A family protein [Gaiellaceae bacterium]
MSAERKIGVYVCHCGGNISDYVDVERVIAAVEGEPGVEIARTAMFTCSDATQQEIISDIAEHELDGMVVASCSPKLHTATFREVAKRAGLNPYEYTQVNIREQCSWAHTDDHEGATLKAIELVRAGIAHTRLSEPLEPIEVETVPRALVVGGGIAGLRAALGLAETGLEVFLVEREPELGGWVGHFGAIYPHDRDGHELIATLERAVRARDDITVFTGSELVEKAGSFGNYVVTIAAGEEGERIQLEVGSIVVATGFDSYQPEAGELGYGIEGVVTLPELEQLLLASDGELHFNGKPVETIAYVYCVGSRQPGGHEYCSRFCCTAAVHDSLRIAERSPEVRQYHLYRDMRTYGRNELLYAESRKRGSLYLRFPDSEPPEVEKLADGRLRVTVRDLLSGGEELAIEPDLLVLVTGAVPRPNEELTGVLKLPLDKDGFFNEIHPKLRPVETVVDGVLIAGACQSPKSASESVTSALAAVTQSASILKKGTAELDPLVAIVDPELCTWCGKCAEACPFDAIQQTSLNGKQVAGIEAAGCKGCGGCTPVCPEDAIDLQGYTGAQIRAMIDGLLEGAAS